MQSNKKEKEKDKDKEKSKRKQKRRPKSHKLKRSQKEHEKIPHPITIDRESNDIPPSNPVLSPTSFSKDGQRQSEYKHFSSEQRDKKKNSPMSPSQKTKKLIVRQNRKYVAKERGTNRRSKKVKFEVDALQTSTNANAGNMTPSRSSSQRREKSKTPKHKTSKKSNDVLNDVGFPPTFVRRRSASNKFVAGNKMDGTPRTPQEEEEEKRKADAVENDDDVIDYNVDIMAMLKKQESQSKQQLNAMNWGKAKTANKSLPAFPATLSKSLYLYSAARGNNVLFPVQSNPNASQAKPKRPKSPKVPKANNSNKRASKRSNPLSRIRRNSDSSTGSDDRNSSMQPNRPLHRGRFKGTSPNKRRRNAVGVSEQIQSQLIASYAHDDPQDAEPPAFVFVDSELASSTSKTPKLSQMTASEEAVGPRRRPQRSRALTTTSVPIEIPSVAQMSRLQEKRNAQMSKLQEKRNSASSPSTPSLLTQSHSFIKDDDKAAAKISDEESKGKYPKLLAVKSDPTSASPSPSPSASPLISPLLPSTHGRGAGDEDEDSGSDLDLEQDSRLMNNSEIKSNIFHNSNSDEELNDKSSSMSTANGVMTQKSAPLIHAQYTSPRGKTSNLFDNISEKASSSTSYHHSLAQRTQSGQSLHSKSSSSRRKNERASSVSSTASTSSSVSAASSVSERDDNMDSVSDTRRRARNRKRPSLSGSISSDGESSDESSISSVSDDSSSYSSDESDSRSVSSADSRNSNRSRTSSRSSISSRSSKSKTPRTPSHRSRAKSTTPSTRFVGSKSTPKLDTGSNINSIHDSLYSKMADMMMMMSQHNYTHSQSMSSNNSTMFSPRKLQSIQINNEDSSSSFVFMNMNGILSPPAITPKQHPTALDGSNKEPEWDQFTLSGGVMDASKKSNASNAPQQFNPYQFDEMMQTFMSSYRSNPNSNPSMSLNSSYDSFGHFGGDNLPSPLNMKANSKSKSNANAKAAVHTKPTTDNGIDIKTTSMADGQQAIDGNELDPNTDLDGYQQRMASIMLTNSYAEDTSCSASDNEQETPTPV